MASIINVKKQCFFILTFLLVLIWMQFCSASIRNWEIIPKEAVSYLQMSDGVLYTLTADGNILETEKNGETKLLPKIDGCRVISIELFDGSLYAGTLGGGIFKSENIKAEKKPIPTLSQGERSDGEKPVVAVENEPLLRVKTDSNQSLWCFPAERPWQLQTSLATFSAVAAGMCYCDPKSSEIPLAEAPGAKKIEIAENETQWSQDGLGGQTVLSLCSHGGYLYAGTANGEIYKIKSGEKAWGLDEAIRLPDTRIQALISRDHDLYAATSNRGILKTQTGTDSWKPVVPELKDKNVLFLYACPTKEPVEKENLFFNKSIGSCDGFLYAITSDSKLYKIDNNDSLFPLINFGKNNKPILAITSKDGCLYAGTKYGEFFIAEDGGNTWTLFNVELKNHSIFSAITYGCYLYAGTNNGAFRLILPSCYEYEKIMSRFMASFSLPPVNKPTAIVANIEPEKQAALLVDGTKIVYLFVFLVDNLNKLELPLDVVITLAGSNRLPIKTKATAYPLLDVVGANNVYVAWLETTEAQTNNYTNYTIDTLEGNKLSEGVLPRCTAEFDKEQVLNIRHPGLHDIAFEEPNDGADLQLQYSFASDEDTTKLKLKNGCCEATDNILSVTITYLEENNNPGKNIIYMPPVCEIEETLLVDDQHPEQFKQNLWPYVYGVTAVGTAGVVALLYHCTHINSKKVKIKRH